MILEKLAVSFAFNLRRQHVTDFSFISLNQKFVLRLKVTIPRHCKFPHIVSAVAYQAMVTHQCPLPLPPPLLDIYSHIQKQIIPECISTLH